MVVQARNFAVIVIYLQSLIPSGISSIYPEICLLYQIKSIEQAVGLASLVAIVMGVFLLFSWMSNFFNCSLLCNETIQ